MCSSDLGVHAPHARGGPGDRGGGLRLRHAPDPGDPAPGLQWQVNAGFGWVALFNDANYSGVTSGTLSVAGVTTALNGYQYRATALNASGSVSTNAAVLTVQSVPAFTTAATTSFTLNAAVSFTVTATGVPAPAITVASGSLPAGVTLTTTSTGADSTTATLGGTPTSGGGTTVSLVLRAGNSAANTDQNFSLVVMTVPAITTQPSAVTAALGETTREKFWSVLARS